MARKNRTSTAQTMTAATRSRAGWSLDAVLVLACGLTPFLTFRAPVSIALRFSAVVLLGAAGLALLLLTDRGRRFWSRRGLALSCAAGCAAVLIAAAASPVRADALTWGWGEGTSAAYWIACLAVFAVCCVVSFDAGIRRAVGVVVASLTALGAFAVIQRLGGARLDQLVGSGSNYLGTLLVLCLPVALGLANTSSSPRSRAAWRGAAASLALCALATGSAAAQVATLIMLAVIAWVRPSLLVLRDSGAAAARVGFAVVLGFAALVLVLSAAQGVLPEKLDQAIESQVTGISLESRLELWRAAANMTAQRPVTGWGPDGFEFGVQGFATQRMFEIEGVSSDARKVMPQDPHSFPMTILAELGVLGLLALGSVAFFWIRGVRSVPGGSPSALDLRASFALGVAGFCLASLAVPWATSQGLVAVVFAGLALAGPGRSLQERYAPSVGAIVASAVLSLAALWLSVSAIAASSAVESAFASATDARVLSAQLAGAQRLQPSSTLLAYQRLWADAQRVGVDLTPAQFAALYDAAPASVTDFAPYTTSLCGVLMSRDSGPEVLALCDEKLAQAEKRSGAYPDPTILRARAVARLESPQAALDMLKTVAWAKDSALLEQVTAEVQQLAR